jgi:hypothetical protein
VKKSEKKSFGLLKLEMADLERFLRKTPLGPLGVNSFQISCIYDNKGIVHCILIPKGPLSMGDNWKF